MKSSLFRKLVREEVQRALAETPSTVRSPAGQPRPTEFLLNMNLEDEVFAKDLAGELSTILQKLAQYAKQGKYSKHFNHAVVDSTGNQVGTVSAH